MVNLKYFDDNVLEIKVMYDGEDEYVCVNFNYKNYLNIYHGEVYDKVQKILDENDINSKYYG